VLRIVDPHQDGPLIPVSLRRGLTCRVRHAPTVPGRLRSL
jgi:hypothetical protein